MRTTGPSNTDLAPAPAYTPPGFWERWQRKSGINFADLRHPVCRLRIPASRCHGLRGSPKHPVARGGAHGHRRLALGGGRPSVAVGGSADPANSTPSSRLNRFAAAGVASRSLATHAGRGHLGLRGQQAGLHPWVPRRRCRLGPISAHPSELTHEVLAQHPIEGIVSGWQ